MPLTDETKALCDRIAEAAASFVTPATTPFSEFIANFLRREGGKLLVQAFEKLGITQVVTVQVDPGVPVTGSIDLTK